MLHGNMDENLIEAQILNKQHTITVGCSVSRVYPRLTFLMYIESKP